MERVDGRATVGSKIKNEGGERAEGGWVGGETRRRGKGNKNTSLE